MQVKRKKQTDGSRNYVNNKDFLKAVVEYKELCKKCEDEGLPLPQVPNYIGKCLYDISHNLAMRPNFIGYSYRDEMIFDGLENAMMCINNFDPSKTTNPFAYFTQVMFFAFIRRIQKEKKQLYIKHKVIENTMLIDSTYTGGTNNSKEGQYLDKPTDYMNDFVEKYETAMNKKKNATKAVEK